MNRVVLWRTIRNSTWLLGGTIMLGAAFVLWVGVTIHQHIVTPADDDDDQADVPVEPEKVRFSPTLGMMTDIVPELNLKKHTASDEHDPEFKGADFFAEHDKEWTLQLMNVTQESVVKSYLAKRPDREKFSYFRYVEKNQPDRFVVTYGVFSTVSQALQTLKDTNFELPSSITVTPERFHTYRPYIVDTNSDQGVTNLSPQGKVYEVRLRSVPLPVETIEPTVTTARTNPAVSSSVTTTPSSGATSEPTVKKTESASTANTSTPESSIQDPFN